jgi:hypothetical protein
LPQAVKFQRGVLLNLLHCSAWKFIAIMAILLAGSKVTAAQAMNTANRSAEIAPFAENTRVSPDWGSSQNFGYTLGIDYTHFIRSIVQPSLEIRMTNANGNSVNERTFTGGLKLQATIHRVHPFATFLAGNGDIYFVHPTSNYLGDNSFVYSLGGGADLDVTSQLSVRVDFTHQQWNIDPQTLTPVTLGIGFAYRHPFHSVGVR